MSSNQGFYSGSQDQAVNPGGNDDFMSSNPWADQQSPNQSNSRADGGAYSYQQRVYQQASHDQQQVQDHNSTTRYHGFIERPPGPPPAQRNTFEGNALVPEAERGEQREAMEQFEMSRSQPESQVDRDVATLQKEFPGFDGSLIAAIYGDSQSISATREMLHELTTENQSQR